MNELLAIRINVSKLNRKSSDFVLKTRIKSFITNLSLSFYKKIALKKISRHSTIFF